MSNFHHGEKLRQESNLNTLISVSNRSGDLPLINEAIFNLVPLSNYTLIGPYVNEYLGKKWKIDDLFLTGHLF